MRFRGAIPTLAVLLIIFLIPPTQSVTPPKAGANCSKVGLSRIFQGKNYTCIKSGKKLVWNKGEAIPKSLPSSLPKVSQSPMTTPSPTAAPTLEPTQSPQPIPSPSPTKIQSFSERWNATGSSALSIFEKSFSSKTGAFPQVELIWRYSDRVDMKVKEEIAKSYAQSTEFWSAYTKIDGVLQIVVGTLDDVEFVCKWRNTYLQMNDSNCTSNFRTDKNRLWDAYTTQLNGKATDLYFITSPSTLTAIDFIPRVQHEFFHDVQHAQTNQYRSKFPCWVEESSAEYFGALVASTGNPEMFLKLRHFSVTAPVGKIQSSGSSKEFWFNWLLTADVSAVKAGSSDWGCAPVQMEGIYHYGILAAEYLNQELGISGILALFRDTGVLGWDKAVEKVFGKSKTAVYEDIAVYMDREYRITMAQNWARNNCVPQGYIMQCSGGL